MRLLLLTAWLLGHALNLCAQNFTDDFSLYTQVSTQWQGHPQRFIINESQQLQLYDSTATGTSQSYLSKAISTGDSCVWNITIQIDFSPSASNYTKIYLQSDESNLDNALQGYFLKIGGISGDEDAIELYRQDGNNTSLLIQGSSGFLNTASNVCHISIERNSQYQWKLYVNYGSGWIMEGEAEDDNYPFGFYFGLWCKYSSSRKDKFFFDDIHIEPLYVDTAPPNIDEIEVDARYIQVNFNEAIQNIAHTDIELYPDIAIQELVYGDDYLFIALKEPLRSAQDYQLRIRNLKDTIGNEREEVQIAFHYYESPILEPDDIIINELLFNPHNNGSDYVELYNRSDKTVRIDELWLARFTESDSKTYGLSGDNYLYPNSFLVITEDKDYVQSHYKVLDSTLLIEANLPTLPDEAGQIYIGQSQIQLDSFIYHKDLHHPLMVNTEGVALERIDYQLPSHISDNWHSAAENTGYGTPTAINSQFMNTSSHSTGSVIFQNSTFSPNYDGHQDFIVINYNMKEAGYLLNAMIYTINGLGVKTLYEQSLLGKSGILKWAGEDNNDFMLPSGIYVLVLDFFHPDGDHFQVRKCLSLQK